MKQKIFYLFLFMGIGIFPTYSAWVPTSYSNDTITCLTVKDGYIIAGTKSRGVLRSNNYGATWSPANNGLLNQKVNTIIVKDNYLFAGTFGGVFRSSDNAQNWTAMNNGLTDTFINSICVKDLYLFAGRYRSSDNGNSWIKKDSGLSPYNLNILASGNGNVYWGEAGFVLYSNNNGLDWNGISDLDGNAKSLLVKGWQLFIGSSYLGEVLMSEFVNGEWQTTKINNGFYSTGNAMLLSDGKILAGGSGGVYLYDSSKMVWSSVNQGFGNNNSRYILSLAKLGDTIFAGTYGSGIWKQAFSDIKIQNLLLPIDQSMDQPLASRFSWTSLSDIENYELQFSGDKKFSDVVKRILGLKDTTTLVTDLATGATYYWRVVNHFNNGSSDISPYHTFSTIPSVPYSIELNSPGDNNKNQPLTIVLYWHRIYTIIPTKVTYTLQVSTDSSFSTTIFSQSGIPDFWQEITGLSYKKTYYWRVNATNSTGTGEWSDFYRFTTINPPIIEPSPPSTPTLVSPANLSIEQPLPITFSWIAVPTATSYSLQVSSDSIFNPIIDLNWIVPDSLVVKTLSGNSTYYWRVRAANNNGNSEWSTINKFVTKISPPYLLSQSDYGYNVTIPSQFKWQSVATASSYFMQIALDTSFMSPIVNYVGISDTVQVVDSLLINTTYYWRVCAANVLGSVSLWSRPNMFFTITEPTSILTLVAPALSDTILTWSPNFIWHRGDASNFGYEIEIGLDSGFLSPSLDSIVYDTSLIVQTLQKEQTYWWRVRAINEGGLGPFSISRSFYFKPEGAGISSSLQKLPNQLFLTANGKFIQYELNKSYYVSLQLFDIKGRRIISQINHEQAAGRYSISLSNEALSTGYYMAVLRAGNSKLTKGLVVLR